MQGDRKLVRRQRRGGEGGQTLATPLAALKDTGMLLTAGPSGREREIPLNHTKRLAGRGGSLAAAVREHRGAGGERVSPRADLRDDQTDRNARNRTHSWSSPEANVGFLFRL